ncbi:hypothetical protein [Pantoea cypripedii]|nr:hypothetical protein [Pantoea cypripedii]
MKNILVMVTGLLLLTMQCFADNVLQPFSGSPGGVLNVIPAPVTIGNNQSPICNGPLGPGSCPAIQQFLLIQQQAAQIPVQFLYTDPTAGPICNGPLGPGSCSAVQMFLYFDSKVPAFGLQVIGFQPGVGRVCNGPLGPGPCSAIAQYLTLQQIGYQPTITALPNTQQIQVINSGDPKNPICSTPNGPIPCNFVQQAMIDSPGVLPSPVPVPSGLNDRQLAINCARQSNLNVAVFAACTGLKVVLNQDMQKVIECAANKNSAPDFANCAAPVMGIKIPDGQDAEVKCAINSGGNPESFGKCMGVSVNNIEFKNKDAIIACTKDARGDASFFAGCAGRMILGDNASPEKMAALKCISAPETSHCIADQVTFTPQQRQVVNCAISSQGNQDNFIACAGNDLLKLQLSPQQLAMMNCAKNDAAGDFINCAGNTLFGDKLSQDQRDAIECLSKSSSMNNAAVCGADKLTASLSAEQRTALNCAVNSKGDTESFMQCASGKLLLSQLTPQQVSLVKCASGTSDSLSFAGCAGAALLGNNASKEQTIALQCAAESQGDPTSMAACAGANLINMGMNLNPEQQIAVQCLASSGGAPQAAAGCMATRLTARELVKCASQGVGGDGCFGDSNDIVGKNGWTARTLSSFGGLIAKNLDNVWGGSNSFLRNPGQIWGGSGSFVRNPGQMWGGNNSIFNNPSQVNVQVGSVGGRRICLPWC